jgi:hypothetical protein
MSNEGPIYDKVSENTLSWSGKLGGWEGLVGVPQAAWDVKRERRQPSYSVLDHHDDDDPSMCPDDHCANRGYDAVHSKLSHRH